MIRTWVLMAFFVIMFAVPSIGNTQSDCEPNERRFACGTACEPTCVNPDPDGCTKQCLVNVCQCDLHFVRDAKTKKCVKVEDCSK